MRSAGCIVNDVLDRKFDKLVVRTKDRPIASGKISVKLSLFYAAILCLLAFIVLINFNLFTILISISLNAISFYISVDEKVYLLATTISRSNI